MKERTKRKDFSRIGWKCSNNEARRNLVDGWQIQMPLYFPQITQIYAEQICAICGRPRDYACKCSNNGAGHNLVDDCQIQMPLFPADFR